MTDTLSHPADQPDTDSSLVMAIVPRLPRMVTATAVVMFATFAGIQFLPQKFEARIDLTLPPGSAMDAEADRLLAQGQLADIVARLPADSIADLRQNGGGVLDTTTLLRQRLMVRPGETGTSLQLAATAGSAARARSIAEATRASYLALVTPPEAMPSAIEAKPEAALVKPASMPMSADSIKALQQRLDQAFADRIKLEGRAERIKALVDQGNLAMLALDAENMPSLGRRLDDLAALEAEQQKLSVTLLPNHPTMRTLNEEVDRMRSDLATQVQSLSEMVVADRDAARRLEDGLRDELLTATAEVKADDTIKTGAIPEQQKPVVTPLPRAVRTDLALGLVGSLAFLGQLGFVVMTRPRKPSEEDLDDAADDMQMVEPALDTPLPPAQPEQQLQPEATQNATYTAETEHNWLTTTAMTDIGIGANWLGAEPAAPVQPPEPRPRPAKTMPAPLQIPPDDGSMAELGAARILAIRTTSGVPTRSRELFAFYKSLGKRVVLVDVSTRRRGSAPGISDLSLGKANFADVIHGSGLYEAALIPWGRQAEFDPQARSVRILIGALSDLYDVVVLTLDRDLPSANAPLTALCDMTIDAGELPLASRVA
ncbi:hypothetical protein VW35_11420 [Devosia soli]|uniref:Polysaccharide chain length determinant N-terminal domain-containing protein n=1 Tax=Devosia soli TaxID=361041 RepID=A0A0F5L7C7_9HYPH|nr:hypothetical protein [Devosia soli]KKB78258.1 hypothetical protein VW35_11420 [Devosia soli]